MSTKPSGETSPESGVDGSSVDDSTFDDSTDSTNSSPETFGATDTSSTSTQASVASTRQPGQTGQVPARRSTKRVEEPPSRPPTTRRDARERALELVYEAECKDQSVDEVIAALPIPPDDFAAALARGVDSHADFAHGLLREFARADWPPERMPVIDRLVLRLAIEELDHHRDTPRAVVIDEAVELAKTFSTDDSGRFVNGMLTSIADHLGREPGR